MEETIEDGEESLKVTKSAEILSNTNKLFKVCCLLALAVLTNDLLTNLEIDVIFF